MLQSKALTATKKILWGILVAIFAVITALAIWLMVDKFILRSPVPSVFGYATLTVETGSMEGTIDIGDMIIIKDTGDYKIGDIITYLPEGDKIPTTHRIINYNEDGSFVTKGDSNNTKDPNPVTTDIIFGEVIKVVPDVGNFTYWLTREGWIYLVAILGILGLGLFMIRSGDDEQEAETNAENNAAEPNGSDTDTTTSAPQNVCEPTDNDHSQKQ